MRFLLSITFNVSIYALLGMSLNLPLGYSGMLLLCGASLFGIGAYTYAIASHYSSSFIAISIMAMCLGAVVAFLIGLITVRLRGDYFAISTLGFHIIINSIFSNWISLFGGPYGQRDIPPPRIGFWTLDSSLSYALLALVVVGTVFCICRFLLNLPYGRSLVAVRDSEVGAIAIGKNPSQLRISALTACGVVAALSGVLYASQITYIDPLSFGFDEMIVILATVIIGGAGTLYGPIAGALIIVVLPEFLRSLSFDDANAGAIRQIILGTMFVVLMRVRPQGVAGRYRFLSST